MACFATLDGVWKGVLCTLPIPGQENSILEEFSRITRKGPAFQGVGFQQDTSNPTVLRTTEKTDVLPTAPVLEMRKLTKISPDIYTESPDKEESTQIQLSHYHLGTLRADPQAGSPSLLPF